MKIKVQEKSINPNTFVGGWYIDKGLCEEIIHYYKYNQKYSKAGLVGNDKIKPDVKESNDLRISFGNFDNVIGVYRAVLQSILIKYMEKFPPSSHCEAFDIKENFNIQHYPKGGGFKEWHCESTGTSSQFHRHLVFMTYLNDVENGGTEFLYQNELNQKDAEQGLTLIWPAHWTHTHKGIVSDQQEKYIITGWYNFTDIYQLGGNR